MSVSFEGVKVGYRVRLTAERGEDVTIIIRAVAVTRSWVTGATPGAVYRARDWDTVEVLSPPKPPLPSTPGIYVSKGAWAGHGFRAASYRHAPDSFSDLWSTDTTGTWDEIRPVDLPADLVRLVPEGEPSGLLEVAREALELVQPDRWSIGSVERAHRILSDAIKAEEAQS